MYGHSEYQSQAATTASPAQLVLMLYDGALGRLDVATEAIAAQRLEMAHTSLVKAQAIVDELNLTLDVDQGGRMAENLREVYLYCSGRLIDANVGKDPVVIAEVARLLQGLRDAWNEACVLGPVTVAG